MANDINSYKSKINDNNDSNKKSKLFIMTEPNFYEKNIFSKTMKNISELSLKAKKVKKYSIDIRNELIKKMEKRQKLNEKQIYTPLYTQIRKSLKDIENEKRIAKKYILSEKEVIKRIKIPLFNSIFKLSQKNYLLDIKNNIDNNAKDENEEKSENNNNYNNEGKNKASYRSKKYNDNDNNKNSLFFKTYSGNLYDKKIINRNNYKNKTYKNNIFDFDANNSKSNILSPTNSNNPINPMSPSQNPTEKNSLVLNTDSNINLNNNNNNINLNLSTINKTLSNTNLQTVKTSKDKDNNFPKVRYKTYFVQYEPFWYNRNKFIKNRIDKYMIMNPLFQKKIIDDELALLFENMKIFQSQYLVDKNLSNNFNKISWYTQRALNSYLEEGTGLLTEISYLLLNGYENIINNFISNPIARITKKRVKAVYDEKKEFTTNISTFSETYIFLQVCYEAYCIITSSSKEEFYISKNNFQILNQFLDRARFIVSKICLDLNNMYREQNKQDKKIIEDCLKKIKNVNRKALFNNLKIINSNIVNNVNIKKKKIKSKIDCHLNFGVFSSGIDSFRYKGPKKLKLTEEQLTNLRISKAFGANSYRELKRNKHFVKFDINSSLVNQLMKYATEEFKSKVMSERIRQRFINSEVDK